MTSTEKRGHGSFYRLFFYYINLFLIIERSASAEFSRVDRTVQLHNATEVNLSIDKIKVKISFLFHRDFVQK